MNIDIKITNLKQVQAALKKSPVIVSKHINTAIKRSIEDVHREAVPKTPVDTGRLRGSYQKTYSALKGTLQPFTKYAYWVEVLPYRHTVGQSHYLEAAVDESSQKVNSNFKTGLSNALTEIARSV